MSAGLPSLFLERLKKIVPFDRIEAVIESFSQTHRPAFRMHHRDAVPAKIAEELKSQGFELEPVNWYPEAFRLLNRDVRVLQETVPYQTHRIYLQGLSSMLVPLALDVRPGQHVLDMCAAPGSKTGQLARMLQGKGTLVANEKIRARFFKMKTILDTLGFDNIEYSQKPGENFYKFENTYDRILLDAPCSSEGRFSLNDPESYEFWSPDKIKDMAFKQRALFKAAFLALKPGGLMVYATCTFAPEENEAVLDWALGRTDGKMEILDWKPPVTNCTPGLTSWEDKTFSRQVEKARRILPNDRMSAFFVALVRKNP